MALGADQALQPHEIVWALRRFVSSTGQESALPPYAPASRADTATRHRPRDDVGLVSWCRATPPLAAPAANLSRRFGTGLPERLDQISSACVSWPEQPSTPGRAPAVYKTAADRLRRAGLCCPCRSGRVGRPASALLWGRGAPGGMTVRMTCPSLHPAQRGVGPRRGRRPIRLPRRRRACVKEVTPAP